MRSRTRSCPTFSSRMFTAIGSPAVAASTARSSSGSAGARRCRHSPELSTASTLVRSTISSGSRAPDSNAAATSMSSGTTPRPATGMVTWSSPASTCTWESRSTTCTDTCAPEFARPSRAFSVDVNDRRPTATRRGSRRAPGRCERRPLDDSGALPDAPGAEGFRNASPGSVAPTRGPSGGGGILHIREGAPGGRAIVTPPPERASQSPEVRHQMVTRDDSGSQRASFSVTPKAS